MKRSGRPEAPARTTSLRAPIGRGRLALLALAVSFAASGCSLTSTGALTSELLGVGFGPMADRVDGFVEGVAAANDQLTGSQVAPPAIANDESTVEAVRLTPRPRSGAFSMNLYRPGDFRSQQTTYWCIPASTQAMMNMIDDGKPNRSKRMQLRFYRVGDRLDEDGSRDPEWEPDPWRGMGISEWAGLLNHYDYGPYAIARAGTRQNAIRKAAKAMRRTDKPVGLVVWRGAHAWVMSGFTATADPAYTNDFTVTHVYVQDPWYPRVSSIWGRSRPPNARVSLPALGEDFLRYGRPGRYDPWRNDKFLLILPSLEPGTPVR